MASGVGVGEEEIEERELLGSVKSKEKDLGLTLLFLFALLPHNIQEPILTQDRLIKPEVIPVPLRGIE